MVRNGCGVRVVSVSPSLVANDRSSETEYTDQYGESDAEIERSKKRMRMTVETSEENSNSLCGQTAVNSGSMALNLELSLGLVGASSQVFSRSKVPSPSTSSRNFHGDEASLNLSLSAFDPYLERKSLYFDPMITEQQDTWTSSEDTSLSPQRTNDFR